MNTHLTSEWERAIRADISSGGRTAVAELAKALGSGGKDIFEQTGSNVVQVEVGGVRVHLTKGESGMDVSVWDVNGDGSQQGDSIELMSWGERNTRRTDIRGSSPGATDGGNRSASPFDLARKLSRVGLQAQDSGVKIIIP
jgi:hypothetical protein